MSDYDAMPTARTAPFGGRPRPQWNRGSPYPEAPTPEPEEPRAIEDIASVMDIPLEEVTPAVRRGISRLMAEIAHLRSLLERQRGLIERLDDEAYGDMLLPLLNRRGLTRELARFIDHARRTGSDDSLAMLYFDGLEGLGRQAGLAAADAAMAHLAALLLSSLRQTDVVAHLGGPRFAAIFTLAPPEAAAAKLDEFAAQLGRQAFRWRGGVVPLSLDYGIVALGTQDDAAEALLAADRACAAVRR